jgi:hypothetical protein
MKKAFIIWKFIIFGFDKKEFPVANRRQKIAINGAAILKLIQTTEVITEAEVSSHPMRINQLSLSGSLYYKTFQGAVS